MTSQTKKRLEIKQRRIFSEEFKRQKVQLIVEKKVGIKDISELYGVAKMTVYRWLYQYSIHHTKGTSQVVQMESEANKTRGLQQEVAKLEQVVGQKQIQIDYLERLIALASEALQVDLKKNFDTQPLSGSKSTPTKSTTL